LSTDRVNKLESQLNIFINEEKMSQLIPIDLKQKMVANSLDVYWQDKTSSYPAVKLFSEKNKSIWLLSNICPLYPDLVYGLCDFGNGNIKSGYVSLGELEDLNVTRDKAFIGIYPLSVYKEAALEQNEITVDPANLSQAHKRLVDKHRHLFS
jgi:hypothetical protein